MSPRTERLLGIIALTVAVVSLAFLFLIKPESFSDPVMAEYLMKLVLYPAVLVFLRALWKTLLDNKIRSKAERTEDMNKVMDNVQEEGKGKK